MWNSHYTTITALEWSLTNHVEFTLHYYNSLGVEFNQSCGIYITLL